MEKNTGKKKYDDKVEDYFAFAFDLWCMLQVIRVTNFTINLVHMNESWADFVTTSDA